MKLRKNLFALIAFCIILSIVASTTVLARNLYINNTSTGLSISSSGTATASGYAEGYQGSTTQIKIDLELQQFNGSWQTIKDWTQTSNSHRCSLSGTHNVSKGYKYRVKATYYGYGAGGGNDKIVSYSSEINY